MTQARARVRRLFELVDEINLELCGVAHALRESTVDAEEGASPQTPHPDYTHALEVQPLSPTLHLVILVVVGVREGGAFVRARALPPR